MYLSFVGGGEEDRQTERRRKREGEREGGGEERRRRRRKRGINMAEFVNLCGRRVYGSSFVLFLRLFPYI